MRVHPLLRRAPRLLRRPVSASLLLLQATFGFVIFVVLQVPGMAFQEFPPARACLWLVVLIAGFLLLVARPRGRLAAVRRRRNRLRPLGPALSWLLIATPVVGLANLALSLALILWMEPGALEHRSGLDSYAEQARGWLPILLFSVAFAPVVEEFGFRAWVQRPIERVLGGPSAVLLTATVFGALHQGPAPNRIFTGVVFGTAVVLTGSIWAGVLLHVGNNLFATLAARLLPADAATTVEAQAWLRSVGGAPVMLGIAGVCAAVLVGIAVRLRRKPGVAVSLPFTA